MSLVNRPILECELVGHLVFKPNVYDLLFSAWSVVRVDVEWR